LTYLRDSNRLPGVFISEESIPNTNNSTDFKKIETVSGHAYWDQEKFFDKKEKKNLVTLSLKFIPVSRV
jgi:hypothetical protein